jgi:hypothetical protein
MKRKWMTETEFTFLMAAVNAVILVQNLFLEEVRETSAKAYIEDEYLYVIVSLILHQKIFRNKYL